MLQWYVINSKPQKEYLVYEQLSIRNIEAYCPQIRVKAVNPRARKIRPYFPGYLFVRANLDQIGPSALQWIPGAAGLVSYGGEPATVQDSLVQAIRKRVEQINNTWDEPVNDLKAGEILEVTGQPFAGYRAIFDAHLPGHERVRVLLQTLQGRKVRVALPLEQLERIDHHQSR
jgi:transcription antitermination factor NusG